MRPPLWIALQPGILYYRQIDRVAPFNDSGIVSQNQTREMNFQTNEDGFYLAIRDESTCIVVSRLLVFYNVCPQETVIFFMRPETLAPIIERLSTPIEVTAQCVTGASPDNGVAPRLTCSQGGVWGTIAGSGCTCNPGLWHQKMEHYAWVGIIGLLLSNSRSIYLFQVVQLVCMDQQSSKSVVSVLRIVRV